MNFEDTLKEAEQGDVVAQYDLGRMYDFGMGVPQGYCLAAKWYIIAAERGHFNAQYRLGFMYKRGEGVTRCATESLKWFQIASNNGYSSAKAVIKRLDKELIAAHKQIRRKQNEF